MRLKDFLFCPGLLACLVMSAGAASYEPSMVVPPAPVREFRGVWIATVANVDWPSKPGLSTAEQKAELISILDHAARLNLNAVIFQVRPACDAMYASQIEPWSEYLTGMMGRPPKPFYDPLAFAIEEAHRRGLELHAWFNPYRARSAQTVSGISVSHISRTRPDLVRKYGKFLWLDPGEPAVQDYSLSVVMDVVKRYDVDGVHFDDYFYPDRNDAGVDYDFPDEASWRKYGAGGKLTRADWRRQNVNHFIERVYDSIKVAKPWVKFGISPFGIWRPGFPPQIRGKDAYAVFYADSRKWLANGWVDYFAPQLYWPTEPKEQSFPALLNWWAEQNVKGRHLWPGIAAFKADKWAPEEIERQLQLARKQSGYIFYGLNNVLHAPALNHTMAQAAPEPALIPASPWLGAAPIEPKITMKQTGDGWKLSWMPGGTNAVYRWIVQSETAGHWKTEILGGRVLDGEFATAPDVVAVRTLDRIGNTSAARVLELRQTAIPPSQGVIMEGSVTNKVRKYHWKLPRK